MTPLFNGTSCLSASVINGHLEIVIRLLQIGGRALALLQYEGGSTCLHLAAFSGRTLIVQVLLAIGGRELLSSRFNGGSTALHITAQEGHVDVVQQLFEVGGSELLMYRDRCHSGFVKVPFSGSKESRGVVAGAGGLASRRRCCTGRGGGDITRRTTGSRPGRSWQGMFAPPGSCVWGPRCTVPATHGHFCLKCSTCTHSTCTYTNVCAFADAQRQRAQTTGQDPATVEGQYASDVEAADAPGCPVCRNVESVQISILEQGGIEAVVRRRLCRRWPR